MAANKNLTYIIYGLISVVIIVLVYILTKKRETFCSCRQMKNKVCTDSRELTSLYEQGRLTENTNFAKIQKPVWKNVLSVDQYDEEIRQQPKKVTFDSCTPNISDYNCTQKLITKIKNLGVADKDINCVVDELINKYSPGDLYYNPSMEIKEDILNTIETCTLR